MTLATVNDEFLRVRAEPSLTGKVLGKKLRGEKVDVSRTFVGPDTRKWAEVKLALSNEGPFQEETTSNPATITGYMGAWLLTFPTNTPVPTTPAPTGTFRLGVHAMQNTRLAFDMAAKGCKFFVVMNDFGGASNLATAYPDVLVLARRFFNHGVKYSAQQVFDGLEGANYKNLIYLGVNENDQYADNGKDLVDRAKMDLEVAAKVRAKGGRYAAGTFSMGCPDFTNPETCRVIKELYAPAYNRGEILFDMHLYSPRPDNVNRPLEWQWYERRWEFLFTKCGFDPRVRGIVSSEVGLDEMGVGGFPAHRYTGEQFDDWRVKYVAAQNKPLVIDGKQYASPILGGALFNLGGNGDPRWEGYRVDGFMPILDSKEWL